VHLDPIALILTLEEGFSITIPDSDAEQITSLGELHSYILYKKGTRHLDFCPSSRVFYRLRHAFMEELAVGRHDITPAALVGNLVPRADRRQHWERLGRALGGWRMPKLEPPAWVILVFALPVIAMFFSFAWMAALTLTKQPAPLAVAALVVVTAVFLLVHRLTKLYIVELPEGCSTVGGLVTALLRWNFARLLPAPGGVPCDETWEKLRGIFSDWSEIDPAKLTPDLRFTDNFDALQRSTREEES
jgi:acyl carrier protein